MLPACLCIPPNVAMQELSKYIPTAKNTHASIEEMLDKSFSMQSVSYKKEVGN
jgi:hypothetical protein